PRVLVRRAARPPVRPLGQPHGPRVVHRARAWRAGGRARGGRAPHRRPRADGPAPPRRAGAAGVRGDCHRPDARRSGCGRLPRARRTAMILHATALEAGHGVDCDTCIVGAGAAGITLALELAGREQAVCVLEAGGESYSAAAQRLMEGTVEADGYPDLHRTRL